MPESKFKVVMGRGRHAWPSAEGKYKVKFVDEMTEDDWAEVDAFIMKYAHKPEDLREESDATQESSQGRNEETEAESNQ